MALVLTACGGGAEESADGEADAAGGGEQEELSPELADAVAEAEELGLQFATSHDQIVERCEQEGHVDVQVSFEDYSFFEESFEEKYPFVDLEWVSMSNAPQREAFLLEVEAGVAKAHDVAYLAPEAHEEISALLGWDLLGMTEAGILDMPTEIISPESRTGAHMASTGIAMAYNADIVDESELPTSWEELGDEKWHGDNLGMVMDIEGKNLASLTPAWGIDRVTELAATIASQDPIWADGHTAANTLVKSGEAAIHPFSNLHSAMRMIDEDPDGVHQIHFVEPVPIRTSDGAGVYAELADEPYCGLLVVEHMASDEMQALYDEDPLQASLAWEGSRMAEMLGDRELSVATPEQAALELPGWIEQILDAYGHPQPNA